MFGPRPPYPGRSRQPHATPPEAVEGAPSQAEVQDSARYMGHRRSRLERLEQGDELTGPALTDTLGATGETQLRRRHSRNTLPGQGHTVQLPTPPLAPPVPEPSKSGRHESLLESIIKLVNSLMTFKGK